MSPTTPRRRPRAGYGPWLVALVAVIAAAVTCAVVISQDRSAPQSVAAPGYVEATGQLLVAPADDGCEDARTGARARSASDADVWSARRANGPARLGYGETGAAGVLAANMNISRASRRHETCVAQLRPSSVCPRADTGAPLADRGLVTAHTISATAATRTYPSASIRRLLDRPRSGPATAACSCSVAGVVPVPAAYRSATDEPADVPLSASVRDLGLLGLLVLGLAAVYLVMSRRGHPWR